MRRTLLLACAFALPALTVRAACRADEAVERLALGVVENRPGEPLSGMASLAGGQCAQDKLVALLPRQFGRPAGFSPALPVEAGRRYTVRYEGLPPQPVSVGVQVR